MVSMIKLLTFLSIYLCFHGALVNAGTFRAPAKNLPNSVRILENQYIIELTAPPIAISDKQSSSKSVEAEHDQLRRDMQSVGIKFQETGTFSTLYNGIYASLSEDDARKVATLQGVKNVWPVLGHTRTPAATGGVGRDQHAHNMTFVNQVRALGYTGKNIKVGIIDSGLDWGHPAFAVPGKNCTSFAGDGCRVKYGKDFAGDEFNSSPETAHPDDDPMDCKKNGHGTHVAGIVRGFDTNFSGVAPNVTFCAYRVFGCEGSTSDALQIM